MLLKANTDSKISVLEPEASPNNKLLHFKRIFTKQGENPFDVIQWEKRKAIITNEKGEVIFEKAYV